MKIAIAGTGYVGFVTAVCLAEKGHMVVCVDVDSEKIAKLNKYKKPLIYEAGLEELMARNGERLSYTTDHASAYKAAEVIFIGVGTPEKKDGSANLAYVYEAAKQIAETAEHDCVVVIKSTVPIGTNEKIEQYIKEHKKHDVNITIVSNPEFLSQGTAVKDTLNASRIVIGAEDDYSRDVMLKLYKDFDVPKLVTDRRSAEMIKYASNDFLALKISYINEIANLCEKIGANIEDVAKGMGLDARIGDKFLRAGIGYGGSCFPKDTKALHWLSNFHDHELKTVKAAIEVNDNQKLVLLKKARKYYDSFRDIKIAVLGLTFKPGTDDLREAPSLAVLPILLEDGAIIQAYDVIGEKNYRRLYPENEQMHYCKSVDEAVTGADICLIFTEWPEIKDYDVNKFERLMKRPVVIDGRNCYALADMEKTAAIYESIGRRVVNGDNLILG